MQRRDFLMSLGAFSSLSLLGGCKKASFEGLVGATSLSSVPTTSCLLFDVSGSIKLKRNAYTSAFQRLVDCSQGASRFVPSFITENPLSDATYPLNVELPSFNPLKDNRIRFEQTLSKAKTKLKTELPQIFCCVPDGRTTPIIDSLIIAEQIFKRYPKTRKRLIIFSDMIETTRSNFNKTIPSAKKIVSDLRSTNSLPDLKNVTVLVIGASAKTTGQYRAIEQFWQEFFPLLGASITEYGPSLIDCPQDETKAEG